MKYRTSDIILFLGILLTILLLILSSIFNPDMLQYLRFWWIMLIPFAIIFNFFPNSKLCKWLIKEQKFSIFPTNRTAYFFKWFD